MTRVALRGRSKKARRPAVVRLTPIILFVRRFEPCLKFYQRALHLRLLRIYEGKNHPAWAELLAGELGRDSAWIASQVAQWQELARGYLPAGA